MGLPMIDTSTYPDSFVYTATYPDSLYIFPPIWVWEIKSGRAPGYEEYK